MNTLEINDIIDVYYDGRKPFTALPKAPAEDGQAVKSAKSQARRVPRSDAADSRSS